MTENNNTNPAEGFEADGISLGIPNTNATNIEQIDNALFVDSNGNLNFVDNFVKNATDINGNPLTSITLQDLYTRINGVYVSNGQLFFKDATVSRPYSLQELVGAYIDWQNRLTTGGIFWIGSNRITNAECNNIVVNVNGDPNLPINAPSISGDARLFTYVNGSLPSNEQGTEVFSIDQYLLGIGNNFALNIDGSWAWYNVPNLSITIPPMDLNKVAYVLAKVNVRLIQTGNPVVFRLFDTTTNVELDRKALANQTSDPIEQQPILSFTGAIPTYQQQLQALQCQCPTNNQTQGLTTEPPHVLVVQFHCDDLLTDNIYSTMVSNISGSLFEDVPNFNDIRYDGLERRLIGLPNATSNIPMTTSSIDVMIFDTTPTDFSGRKSGNVSFSSQTSSIITFDTPFTSSEYTISLSCSKNINLWYNNKTAQGFTINSNKTFTGTVDWIVTKLAFQGDA